MPKIEFPAHPWFFSLMSQSEFKWWDSRLLFFFHSMRMRIVMQWTAAITCISLGEGKGGETKDIKHLWGGRVGTKRKYEHKMQTCELPKAWAICLFMANDVCLYLSDLGLGRGRRHLLYVYLAGINELFSSLSCWSPTMSKKFRNWLITYHEVMYSIQHILTFPSELALLEAPGNLPLMHHSVMSSMVSPILPAILWKWNNAFHLLDTSKYSRKWPNYRKCGFKWNWGQSIII